MSLSDYSNNKRQNILKIASDLFLEKGFSGTSTSELVRQVGGSKTTIYTHFGDKAGLFTAVVDEVLKEAVSFPETLKLSALSTRNALIAIAEQYLKIVLSQRYVNLIRIVVAEVSQFPEIGNAFYEHGPGQSYNDFQAFLEQKVADGELTIANTRRATDLFFGTLLHRELLLRLYGVQNAPLRNRKSVASDIIDEFLEFYI
jgi:TetR/AcrR family transcriptional regulator, mexJK operon transcriptional repressor